MNKSVTQHTEINIGNGVCAYVAGGLGNQLFILAAAWEQAKRLECPLYLDTSNHDVRGGWRFELEDIGAPGVVLGPHSPWTSVRLSKERVLPFPRFTRPVRRRVFFERDSSRYDPAINDIRPGTTIFGYFQSARYFERSADSMHQLIESAPTSPAEADLLAHYAATPRLTLHLRRGDYLNAPESRRVIATTAYARRAYRLLQQMGAAAPLRLFSDSPNLVQEELGDLDLDIEFADPEGVLSPVNTMRAMSYGSGLVMSNSSFSWWAGWLMRRRDSNLPVIAPRPWNETGTAKADLLFPEWIGLDAR
ncbi:glycosyl transferase family 11 [Diaminobutyricimonas aerilata]|uniref:Glycosyl transferase family 11 n=1 Tax=Diaminobutyricimonas aerilata TaxID=1162967 RepID=A0A2M9CH65_9MICO|nr:alpha-1,2-fucosyltransferase [Diaminobutyricimonas aerilata]PJJ71227.1 glycosyl transferase family 11 [Diaminobutyricimonas aerilata]